MFAIVSVEVVLQPFNIGDIVAIVIRAMARDFRDLDIVILPMGIGGATAVRGAGSMGSAANSGQLSARRTTLSRKYIF
ncbi:MAG TPA: hypothetical protein VG889_06550 [Rhizomicrobium sp.]|nr:hypothetical protein [Rhizomicrobium sp.]